MTATVNPFENLDPKDGFHITLIDTPSQVRVDIVAYAGGELSNVFNVPDPSDATQEIYCVDEPDDIMRGSMRRLSIMLDAVTRYLNTGGTWVALNLALAEVYRFTHRGNLHFTDYHLVDTYMTTEGLHQHIFAANDGSGQAVLWEEPEINEHGGLVGGFVDITTLQALQDQEESEDVGEEEAEEGSAAGTPVLPQLPYLGDPEGPGQALPDPGS